MNNLDPRTLDAVNICQAAGNRALAYFRDRTSLTIDQKGQQDWVSDADRNVEVFIRNRLTQAWPDDGVIGEEHETKIGQSEYKWVIDPIDGTTNFVNGIPAWVIVLAGVRDGQTQIGVIHDPNSGETLVAERGKGATLNCAPIKVANGTALNNGTVAVGYSNRANAEHVVPLIAKLVEQGAMFHRNASGALSLAYVASGRLLGYIEPHMNAWDCLAGQLLVQEAGGMIEEQNADDMIRDGGRVVVGTRTIFADIQKMANECWAKS